MTETYSKREIARMDKFNARMARAEEDRANLYEAMKAGEITREQYQHAVTRLRNAI